MLPYQTLVVIEEKSDLSVYRQIANSLISLIQQGKIAPGTFLPGTRQMAGLIHVHRNTVTNAYNELLAQNWIETLPRKGYRVIPELPLVKPRSFRPATNYDESRYDNDFPRHRLPQSGLPDIPSHIDRIIVNDGLPDIDLMPFKEIMTEYRMLIKSPELKNILASGDNGGSANLKNATCRFLNNSRGLNITPDKIMLTRGAQMAIFIAVALLVRPGDEIVLSDPDYIMAGEIFKRAGAVIHRITADDDGINVDELDQLLSRKTIKLLYLVPHHHHPTTVTLSIGRRAKLLSLVNRFKFWIIEDDFDYDYQFKNKPIIPLASGWHGGKIIYIGSFTKLLAPSFRLGYLVGPVDLIKQAITYRRLIDTRGDVIMEEALAVLIDTGRLDRHIKRSNKIYESRCELACRLISESLGHAIQFKKPDGGLAIWLKFNERYPLAEIISKAAAAGLVLAGSAYHTGEDKKHNGIRFGFASLSEAELCKAVAILKQVIA